MIDIDNAIKQSKDMKNISNGGSACFDFGDVVLVKYTCPTKYFKPGEHTREKSEEIMEAINRKANEGVNTPRHLSIRRIVEGEDDVCYVLQDKCPGYNCASLYKYGVSFDEMCESLKKILDIPLGHYKKLIIDGCKLFEMGYEAKNKNLFYDENSGFWYIDFLENNTEYTFDSTNIKKVFEALNYRIPKPIQFASRMEYNAPLTEEQSKKQRTLENAIKAKTLLGIKSALPNFEKYEKFFLLDEEEDYKKYLMQEGIVKKDLINFNQEDYEVFSELYEIVIEGLLDKVINKGADFWSIECNDIRNDSAIFHLQTFFARSVFNDIKRDEYEDDYDYRKAIEGKYETVVLNDLVTRLKNQSQNESVTNFISEASKKLNPSSSSKK